MPKWIPMVLQDFLEYYLKKLESMQNVWFIKNHKRPLTKKIKYYLISNLKRANKQF